jgi:hypothetical protein
MFILVLLVLAFIAIAVESLLFSAFHFVVIAQKLAHLPDPALHNPIASQPRSSPISSSQRNHVKRLTEGHTEVEPFPVASSLFIRTFVMAED